MNTPHSLSDSRPGPACAAFEPLLPLVSHDLLEPEEARTLQAHVADCAHCRARLAAYDRLDAALLRRFEQIAVSPLHTEDIMKEIEEREAQREGAPLAPVLPLRRHSESRTNRLFSWVGALAAVLVIALIATALVASHHSPTAKTKTSTSTAAPGASAGVYFSAMTADSSPQTLIYALNPTNGSVRWRVKMSADVTINPALVDHGALYVLAQDYSQITPGKDPNRAANGGNSTKNAVYAFRTSDGKGLWHIQTGGIPAFLVLADGMVYASTLNGTVYALKASNGSVMWHTSVGDSAQISQVVGGVVYVSTYHTSSNGGVINKLVALNASDGSVKWRFDLQGSVGTVQASNGLVAVIDTKAPANKDVAGVTNSLVMLNASDGSVKWRYQGDPSTVGDTFMQQDAVYVTLLDGSGVLRSPVKLQALNASDGSVRWEKSYANFNVIRPDPGSQGGKVYLTANNTIVALNAQDGSEAWQAKIGNNPYFEKLATETLFAQTQTELYALNADDGSVIWRYALGNAAYLTAANNQQVYGMAKPTDPQQHWMLRFFALDAHTGQPLWHYDATASITLPIVG